MLSDVVLWLCPSCLDSGIPFPYMQPYRSWGPVFPLVHNGRNQLEIRIRDPGIKICSSPV